MSSLTLLTFLSPEVKPKVTVIGISTAIKAANQFGCPKVENMRTVGWNASVQQDVSRLPLKTRHVRSYPKWEGIPHKATTTPERTEARSVL